MNKHTLVIACRCVAEGKAIAEPPSEDGDLLCEACWAKTLYNQRNDIDDDSYLVGICADCAPFGR